MAATTHCEAENTITAGSGSTDKTGVAVNGVLLSIRWTICLLCRTLAAATLNNYQEIRSQLQINRRRVWRQYLFLLRHLACLMYSERNIGKGDGLAKWQSGEPMDRLRHVLVVDDDGSIRGLLSAALEDRGDRVTSVADGRSMRDVLSRDRVDVVVLDVRLPGEDGHSLALHAQAAWAPRHLDFRQRRSHRICPKASPDAAAQTVSPAGSF